MLVAIGFFVIILGLLAYLDTKKPKNYPPGPSWLPIIGSAHTIKEWRKKAGYLYKATAEMAEKYGPVIGLRVGKDLVVVVYGKNQIREFLTSDDLAGRPTGPFFDMRTWGERRGVLLTDSDFWQEQRRFILRQLREFGFGRKNMSSMIEEETGIMVESYQKMLAGKKSVILNMESAFNIHILNTLWMMMAGIRYSPEDKNLKSLQDILGRLFSTVDMVGAPFSQFPILKFIAPEISGYKLYVETHLQLWEFLYDELKRHKETWDENNLRDFMDVYLKMLNSPECKESFCEKQLLAICLDMFMAGSETTSKSLGFCFLNLIMYPDVQKKAQQEIDAVIGRNRLPSLEDRPQMPYMECVVLEALRMFSGRAFTVPHRAFKDTHLNGYIIPKDTMVIANMHGTLMGPESGVEDPETFKPERYLKDGKITLADTYLPFGFGKHRCLGETLARANVFLFTASLLQHFNFSIVPGSPPTTECIDGVTPGPLPFKALVTPRD
ncbi:probable cytochrome P450 303a1 [Tribolium madens]|uniref:probable cytochrome P450 303a1 n=1 Tax=Tribolium madens TaxID=41895 RepID=UPI001CF7643A|nr:probable cytochrome P450 303a1 [Tribolium madens]